MKIGSVAPNINLYNTERQKIDLNTFSGKKMVLFFFPAAWTGTCTNEMCSVRDDFSFYTSLDTVVIGISVDSPFALKRFKEDHQLSFELLSDFNKEVIRAYGIYREEFVCEMHGVAERAVFIIGSDGTIQYKEVLEKPGNLPDFAAAKRALESIK